MFIASSSFQLASGSSTDEYGDITDVDTTSTAGVPGAVTETSRTTFDPASGRYGSVDMLIGRFHPGTVLGVGDRVTDERTGDAFTVTSVHVTKSGLYTPDLVVELSRNS